MALLSGLLRNKILNSARYPLLQLARNATDCKDKKQSNPFITVRPEKEDFEEILEVMWDSYYKDEPIIKYLGLGKTQNNVFDEHAINALSQGFSLIMKCKFDGSIVAAAINEGTCPWDPDMMDKFACTLSNVKMRQLYQFYAYIQRAPDLWKQACAPKIFEIAHLFVRPDDRMRGAATHLVRRSIEYGADCGFRCIRLDASNSFTSRICEKLRMKLIYEIPYCTYIGSNEQPVVNPPPPDTSMKVYVATPLLPKAK